MSAASGVGVQADTVVPEALNPARAGYAWRDSRWSQALNRYSYVLNNPLRYTDPSGHWFETVWDIANILWDIHEVRRDPSLFNIGALVVDVGAAVLPFVPGGVGLVARGGKAAKLATQADEAIDVAKAVSRVDEIGDIARLGKEAAQEATGQMHHVLSKKILDELAQHEVLKGVFERGDFVVEAIDQAAQRGYQTWHRVYDAQVTDWLRTWPEATREQFLRFLQELYGQPDLSGRFPAALELLKSALEAQP